MRSYCHVFSNNWKSNSLPSKWSEFDDSEKCQLKCQLSWGPKSQRPEIWWDLRISVFVLAKWSSQNQTPRFSKTARPRSQFLKKISCQDPNEVKRTKEVPPKRCMFSEHAKSTHWPPTCSKFGNSEKSIILELFSKRFWIQAWNAWILSKSQNLSCLGRQSS